MTEHKQLTLLLGVLKRYAEQKHCYNEKGDDYTPSAGSYDEDNCDEIADAVEEWLSDEIEWEYEDRDYDKGWNDALCTIKGKLR